MQIMSNEQGPDLFALKTVEKLSIKKAENVFCHNNAFTIVHIKSFF